MDQNLSQTVARSLEQTAPLRGWTRPDASPPFADVSPAEVALRLQTTLDVEAILDAFSDMIRWAVPHDGFSFEHEALGLHLSRGRLSRHSCTYHLAVDESSIGELKFLRGRRFREAELEQFEGMIAGLVYPLRNALLYRQALKAAQTDPLTGLYNRAAMERLLPRELAGFHRTGEPLGLLVLDLDHFKRVNDTLGHSTGDRVLRAVAHCIEGAVRKSDVLFRFGGEEFVAVLRMSEAAHGVAACERILDAMRECENLQHAAAGMRVTASIGLALARPGDTPETLLERADRAMYAAKQAGRDQVHLAPLA